MSIDKKELRIQLGRLRSLNYFPAAGTDQEKELELALKSCRNEFMLAAVVNEWVQSQTERPTPADLYRLIQEHKDAADKLTQKPKCQTCSGSRWVEVWFLVTFRGNSEIVKKSERLLPESQNPIAAMAFARSIENQPGSDHQTILSGAVACACQSGTVTNDIGFLCSRCRDFGFYGGEIGGQYAGPWRVCSCRAGEKPGVNEKVDEANTARDKILKRFPHGPGRDQHAKPDDPMRSAQDVYRGEF